MKALVTGASSGIGKSIAIYLSKLGYEVIAVARDKDKLEELKNKYNFKIIALDLSVEENNFKLYDLTKNENIDILVNNAGFGSFGEFKNIPIEKEINMIDLNVKSLHILTKLFLKDFIKKDKGYILNVSSIAAFQAGPLMATYYGTKAYVLRLSTAIYEELKKDKSNVHISVLCPGPVDTNFNKVANVKFNLKSTTSDYVAKYSINQMLKNKLIIIPTLRIKLAIFFSGLIPLRLKLKIVYMLQNKKR
ncbi:MAG TPA: SDR family oxidoreductase [Bacilli bacterium]|nr:SDR family oxidoreductase [Bacilli bacterium]